MKIVLAALFIISMLMPSGVNAQQVTVCASRAVMVASLKNRYNEEPDAQGLADKGGSMIEIFASPSGSWTMVSTTPDKISCMIASGKDYTRLPRAAPADDPT